MKYLHIFRSEPTEDVLRLTAAVSDGDEAVEFELFGEDVDYDRLVKLVFSCDKTISWW